MKRTYLALAICLFLLCAGTGCEKTEEVTFVATDPVPNWNDFQLGADDEVEDTYAVLVEGRTTGLFPGSIAVARVQPIHQQGEDAGVVLRMHTEPEVELLPWNSLLDDQRAVSGVFPVKPIALQGEPVTISNVLDAASVMSASVCLVYATADLSETESEVRGALYDTNAYRPLAVIHSRARIDNLDAALAELPDPAPWHPAYFHAARDPRYHDAPGMAIYKFEALVRQCVIDLRKTDTPLENQPTEGWVPELPPEILIWPPPSEQH